jgi:hypothetical protein
VRTKRPDDLAEHRAASWPPSHRRLRAGGDVDALADHVDRQPASGRSSA